MSKIQRFLVLITLSHIQFCHAEQHQAWIRNNQLGFLPRSLKIAVLVSKGDFQCFNFKIIDAESNQEVYFSKNVTNSGAYGPFTHTFRLNFSEFQKEGRFFIQVGDIKSRTFAINFQVYKGTADFLLRYLRQQRCGFNPFLKDSCHTHDGFTIYGPMPDGTHIDVTGGWHDASDYLQYSTTSANATYHLLFAYEKNPTVFADEYDAAGLPRRNELPDVLDEARWGLEWLLKMHPRPDWMFNQIADDRDHLGFRLPTLDSIDYGKGLERPVYFCTGDVQGLFKYRNRTTGVASTAGKFASAFALGARIFKSIDPQFARVLMEHARTAYEFGLKKPGTCQTAPCRAPYFYEEDNWADDMELGAAMLAQTTGKSEFINDATHYSKIEPITPWMGADSARHYQWYPFMNHGHFKLWEIADNQTRKQLIENYRLGIQKVIDRAKDNAFLSGIPFIWCSNNLITAFVTQCWLYREMSADSQFLEVETAMRDWLFGCNPWGISMIIGLPENGVYSRDPHSAFSYLYNYPLDGGLIDGPVYGSIFQNLKYVHLREPDEYAAFQSDLVVYHDDMGDYSTNEPTMDGTASLIFYLAAMQREGMRQAHYKKSTYFTHDAGAIIRGDKMKKEIALVFTADKYGEGAISIRETLLKHQIKASFFFTGNFYRNPEFFSIIRTLKTDDHYLGPHSDEHLLYCSWENRDSLLVTREQFVNDLEKNYAELEKLGILKSQASYFIPPFEWYNTEIARWSQEMGIHLINFTPGTRSHADYTTPDMKNYLSSQQIYDSIINYEKSHSDGLNGFILLMHLGTDPTRKDKFYSRLDELILLLKAKQYQFKRIDTLLN